MKGENKLKYKNILIIFKYLQSFIYSTFSSYRDLMRLNVFSSITPVIGRL